ncbi:PAS domain S-box protein [Candidatus Riflebacteria bacterium]
MKINNSSSFNKKTSPPQKILQAVAANKNLPATAFFTGLFAVLLALLIIFIFYRISFNAMFKKFNKFYMNTASIIRTDIQLHTACSDAKMLNDIKEHWKALSNKDADTYICVVDRNAQLLLHSAHPQTVGNDAGKNRVLGTKTQKACNLLQLVQQKRDHVGEYISSAGQEQIAAFSYVEGRDWVVGVHRSKASIEREIWLGRRCLVLGLLLICGLIISISLFLLFHSFASTRAKLHNTLLSLEQESAKTRMYLDAVREMIVVLNSKGEVIRVNEETCRVLGYPEKEILGKNWFNNFLPANIVDAVKGAFLSLMGATTLSENEFSNYENPVLTRDGQNRMISWNNRWLTDEEGNVIGTLGSGRDITEQQRLEKNLIKAQQISKMGFLDLNLKTDEMFWSEGVYHLVGIAPDAGKQTLDSSLKFVHPDDQEYAKKNLELAIEGKKKFHIDFRVLCSDGRVIWVNSQGDIVHDKKGTPLSMLGSIVDITERKRAETDLEESENRFRELVESINDVIFEVAADGRITYVSPVVKRVLGYTPDDIIGQTFSPLVHPDDLSLVHQGFIDVQAGRLHPSEYRLRRKDGDFSWVCSSSRPVQGPDGRIIGIRGLLTDISERKKAEEERIKLLQAIETAGEAIFVTDIDGSIVYANSGTGTLFGYRKLELLHKRISHFNADKDPERVMKDIMAAAAKEGIWKGEIKNRRKDGTEFISSAKVSTLKDENGKVINFITTQHDITRRKKVVNELERSQTFLNAVGRIASVGGWEMDAETFELRYTDETYHIHEIPVGQIPPLDEAINFYHRDDQPKVKHHIQRALEHGEPYDLELRFITAKGKPLWVNAICKPHIVNGKTVKLSGTFQDITERKRAEDKLQESDKRHRDLLENMPSVCFFFDREGNILSWNKTAEEVYGYTKDEAIGASSYDLIVTPQTEEATARLIKEVFEGKSFDGSIWQDRDKDGKIGWRFGNAFPLFNNDGTVLCGVNMNVDITEQKQAEEAVRLSEKKYRNLVETLREGYFFYSHGTDGRFTYISPSITDVLGYSQEEFLTHFSEYMTAAPANKEVFRHTELSIKGIKQPSYIVEILHKDGNIHLLEVSETPLLAEDGTVLAVEGIARDITERERAAEELKRSEQRWRAIFENAGHGIVAINKEKKFTEANDSFLNMLGYSREELSNLTPLDITHPEDIELSRKKLGAVWKGEILKFNHTKRLINRDGQAIWVDLSVTPLQDSSGNIISTMGVLTNVDKRIKAEKAVKLSEEKYRRLVEISPYGIEEIDSSGKIIFASPALEKMHGYGKKEMVGMNVSDLKPQLEREEFSTQLQFLMSKQPQPTVIDSRSLTKDGRIIDVEVAWEYKRDEAGKVIGFVSVITDITQQKKEQREAEIQRQQLLHADKLATLGTLVAGVAHEINNPNSFIMLNAPILKELWQGFHPILEEKRKTAGDFTVYNNATYDVVSPRIPALFEAIQEGSERIKNIVENLKDYSRQDDSNLKGEVNLIDVVNTALVLTQNKIKNATRKFTFKAAQNLPHVMGNRQALEQVVINLILNACDALQNKEQGIRVITSVEQENNLVGISIQDEGVGIPDKLVNRITDPFFTTKKDTGGTGLGLSISSSIIHEHGGNLTFESLPGQGTRACISLPINRGDHPDIEDLKSSRLAGKNGNSNLCLSEVRENAG